MKAQETPKEPKKDKEEKSLEQEGNEVINNLLSKKKSQDKFISLLGTFAQSIAQDVMTRKIKYQAALSAGFNEEQAFEYCMKDFNQK